MDEASLAFHLSGVIGTVLSTRACRNKRPGSRSKLSSRRGNVTYLASICSDPAVAHLLPQILLGNHSQFLKNIVKAVQSKVGGNIFFWREPSAWNTHILMQRYILLLCSCLGEILHERAVYFLLDMAPCHLHPTVLKACMDAGLRVILIPAGLTSVLQPLDSHVFRQFRAKMQHLWLECKVGSPQGEVSLDAWLGLVSEAIQSIVVAKPWRRAFERVGILSAQEMLSPKVLDALGWKSCPKVPSRLPGLGQACMLFPRRTKANVAMWVQWTPGLVCTPIATLD